MFTAVQFKDRLNQMPFKPFRIHMTDGKSYDITNHDIAMVKRHALAVGIDLDQDSIPGTVVQCAITHITRVEEMSTAQTA